MKLGIVYHMPFWLGADGRLREIEGSFARYVDSLAPYFDEVSLCVPVLPAAPASEGTVVRSPNVTLAPLPPFEGALQFYPRLPAVLLKLFRWAGDIDVLHCRVPSPAAIFAFALARLRRRPAFVLVVGDLRALLPLMPYRGVKKMLWRAYTEFEEANMQWMTDHALAFANGAALARKHTRPERTVVETTTTTIHSADVADHLDTCGSPTIRLLTVSRIDPRKGLRVLPAAVRQLVNDGIDARLDIVGPTVGGTGRDERAAIAAEAARLGVGDRITFAGAVALDRLLPMYRQYDVFVLPTLPGEGIPRVLLEAMSAGLPVVASRVAGIPSLVAHEVNGLLLEQPAAADVAAAVSRVVRDARLRQNLITQGYGTARRFTLEAQASTMMETVSDRLQIALRPVTLPAA